MEERGQGLFLSSAPSYIPGGSVGVTSKICCCCCFYFCLWDDPAKGVSFPCRCLSKVLRPACCLEPPFCTFSVRCPHVPCLGLPCASLALCAIEYYKQRVRKGVPVPLTSSWWRCRISQITIQSVCLKLNFRCIIWKCTKSFVYPMFQ